MKKVDWSKRMEAYSTRFNNFFNTVRKRINNNLKNRNLIGEKHPP